MRVWEWHGIDMYCPVLRGTFNLEKGTSDHRSKYLQDHPLALFGNCEYFLKGLH